MVSSWEWKSLNKLSDQNFFLTPTVKTSPDSDQSELSASLHKKVSMADRSIRFKASMHRLSSNQVLFSLAPDAGNVAELHNMGLSLSDLPLSSCQRDAVLLGEHVAQEADKAHELDKLSRRMTTEKDLSNTLLNNLLPKKVVKDLRRGKTVEPVFHEHVTLFFSDVVGFTNICDQVEPWDVIDMMNQLYSVMDFLASHFDLYKVETVGDSYLCASGLPDSDEFHAEKIANFALAVLECVKHVKSPIDGSPIQLRIGIHTGGCTSGVVGTLTPHYCLFGTYNSVESEMWNQNQSFISGL
jgi:guanylate cyclase soluble subunit beta